MAIFHNKKYLTAIQRENPFFDHYRNTSIKPPGAYLHSTPNHLGAYSRGGLIRGGAYLTSMCWSMGAYSRGGLIRGWGLNRGITVYIYYKYISVLFTEGLLYKRMWV